MFNHLADVAPSSGQWLRVAGLLVLVLAPTSVPPSAQSAASNRAADQLTEGSDSRADLFRDCGHCPEMAIIPAGSYMMGSSDEETGRYANEGPQHKVILQSFALGRYEVTRGEFARFIADTGYTTGPCVYWDVGFGDIRRSYDLDLHNPSHQHRQSSQHPVTCVSWYDAQAYVAWLREQTGRPYRLPSESEWEYAARSGTGTRYFWGNDLSLACGHANGHDDASKKINALNWVPLPCNDGFGLTAPVGSFEANGFSLFDMAGNLWEWVEDHYHQTYDDAPADGSPWLSPGVSHRVLRGGSWEDEPRALRSASRIWSRPMSRLNSNGFRIALTLSHDLQ